MTLTSQRFNLFLVMGNNSTGILVTYTLEMEKSIGKRLFSLFVGTQQHSSGLVLKVALSSDKVQTPERKKIEEGRAWDREWGRGTYCVEILMNSLTKELHFQPKEGLLQCSLRGHKFNSPLLAYVPVLLFLCFGNLCCCHCGPGELPIVCTVLSCFTVQQFLKWVGMIAHRCSGGKQTLGRKNYFSRALQPVSHIAVT